MTGTTVRLGKHPVQQDWNALGITGQVLASFVVGSLVGRVLIEAAARARFRRCFHARNRNCAAAMGDGVCASSTGDTLCHSGTTPLNASCGNGIPDGNADADRASNRTHDIRHRDDHVDHQRKAELRDARRDVAHQARFIFSIWLLYVIGAICGTYAALHWHRRSFLVPACMLLPAICADLIQPLSIEEEREQSER